MKVLVFDIWGDYAHFKKIYATTSAISYILPTKPAIYGYVGAILGLEKFKNEYLTHFQNKSCLIGITVMGSRAMDSDGTENTGSATVMRRMGINLKADIVRPKAGNHPKPTLTEYVYKPRYRIYFTHKNENLYRKLKASLESHTCVYTPTLGLAGLISNFSYIGEFEAEASHSQDAIPVHTVIPKLQFTSFGKKMFDETEGEFRVVEQTMYAIEMDQERNVTERDDILVERMGRPIYANVTEHYQINGHNVIMF